MSAPSSDSLPSIEPHLNLLEHYYIVVSPPNEPKIPNESFSSYQKDEDLYKLQLVAYAHTFPNFPLLPFVAPSLNSSHEFDLG